MFRLFKYLQKRDYLYLVFILGFVALQVICDLALPEYFGKIIALIQEGASAMQLWDVGLVMIGISLGSVASSIAVGYFASVFAANMAKNVRGNLFNKVNSFSLDEISKFSTASLITRTTNDITQVQMTVVMFLRMALSAPVMAIASIIKIASKSAGITLITGCAIFGIVLLIIMMVVFVMPKFKVIQNQTDKLNATTRENLTGLRVVRAYNAQNGQSEKFVNVNDGLTKTNLFVNRMAGILMPGMSLILHGLTLAVVWVGAYLVGDGLIIFEDVAVYMQYAVMVLMNFVMLTMLFTIMPRAIVSGRRISEVLRTESKIIDGAYAPDATQRGGLVEFKNVYYAYENSEDYVLEDISFTAKNGETVAFIGSTGSGKSTLINLIPRFYDATQGDVFVDGVNVKDYKGSSLNDKIGYVPQVSALFGGSIRSNIQYGKKDATDEEIWNALETAQAGDFVKKLNNGLDYSIAQRGKNVSGGQRQRLQIARAVVKNPEIYIFDDSFSALDYKTDKALRRALKAKTGNATSIIVAQRIGTIIDADKIIVLDEGKIVGEGKHKQLLKDCKQYREIAYSQLSKEELEDGEN